MHPQIKLRAARDPISANNLKPLLLHEVVNLRASALAASRRHQIATQPRSGTANHARHHVSRHTQS